MFKPASTKERSNRSRNFVCGTLNIFSKGVSRATTLFHKNEDMSNVHLHAGFSLGSSSLALKYAISKTVEVDATKRPRLTKVLRDFVPHFKHEFGTFERRSQEGNVETLANLTISKWVHDHDTDASKHCRSLSGSTLVNTPPASPFSIATSPTNASSPSDQDNKKETKNDQPGYRSTKESKPSRTLTPHQKGKAKDKWYSEPSTTRRIKLQESIIPPISITKATPEPLDPQEEKDVALAIAKSLKTTPSPNGEGSSRDYQILSDDEEAARIARLTRWLLSRCAGFRVRRQCRVTIVTATKAESKTETDGDAGIRTHQISSTSTTHSDLSTPSPSPSRNPSNPNPPPIFPVLLTNNAPPTTEHPFNPSIDISFTNHSTNNPFLLINKSASQTLVSRSRADIEADVRRALALRKEEEEEGRMLREGAGGSRQERRRVEREVEKERRKGLRRGG